MARAFEDKTPLGGPKVINLCRGKRVAVIGRAGSMLRFKRGREIDACDVIIRVNWVLPIPASQVPFVGSRTDLLIHCKRARTARDTASNMGVPTFRVMGRARKLAAREFFTNPGKFRPTTGFCAVLMAYRAGASQVRPYGFDFFRSGHVQEREPDGDDYSRPLPWAHSPTLEKTAMRHLIQMSHGIIIPDKILREALK